MVETIIKLLTVKNLVLLAGSLHFCQVPAAFFGPDHLNWKEELKRLSPLNRRIYLMIAYAIIGITLGLGLVVVLSAEEIASGSRLGVSLCFFLAAMWGYRAFVQMFVYAKVWIGGYFGRLTHYGLISILVFKSGLYLLIALLGVFR